MLRTNKRIIARVLQVSCLLSWAFFGCYAQYLTVSRPVTKDPADGYVYHLMVHTNGVYISIPDAVLLLVSGLSAFGLFAVLARTYGVRGPGDGR